MGAFSGNKRVHSFLRRLFKIATRTATHNANAPADFWPFGDQVHFPANSPSQTTCQIHARNRSLCLAANELALVKQKWPQLPQSQRRAELGVVPELWMGIERKMRTINRKVIIDQKTEQLVPLSRPRVRRAPKQSMMHEQQIRFRSHSEFHRGEAGVYSRSDPCDGTAILHLQTVDRTLVVVDRGGAQEPIAIANDRCERDF
jgi:hypothetical protein